MWVSLEHRFLVWALGFAGAAGAALQAVELDEGQVLRSRWKDLQ